MKISTSDGFKLNTFYCKVPLREFDDLFQVNELENINRKLSYSIKIFPQGFYTLSRSILFLKNSLFKDQFTVGFFRLILIG